MRLTMLRTWTWLVLTSLVMPVRADDWPCWRGPRGDGHSQETNLPVQWDVDTASNVAWKIAVPGTGHASPIVSGNHLFLVTCLTETQERMLMDIEPRTGHVRWQRTVVRSPLETKHGLNSYASSTPATDGELVYVTFLESDNRTVLATNVSTPRDVTLGRMKVSAFDFEGKERWSVACGDFVSVHGFCTCPVIHRNLLILNGDHDGDSYVVALDKHTGKQIWRVERPNKTRSYVTPIVRNFAGREQLIMCGSKSVTAYDPDTGKLIWYMDGPTEQFVASMVDDARHVFLTAGYPDKHILAIDPTGTGNVTESHIVWRSKKNCAYVPSPIIVGDYFLVTSDDGIASCYDAAKGDRLWFTRLGNHYSGSPVAAAGLVYFTADNGITKVIRPGKVLEIIAENKLGEECVSSPAISDGQIYFRTTSRLIALRRE